MIQGPLTHRLLRQVLIAGGFLATVESVARLVNFYGLTAPHLEVPVQPNYYQFNSPLTFCALLLSFSIWLTYYAFRARVGPRLSLVSLAIFGLALGLEIVMAYLLNVTAAEWTNIKGYGVPLEFVSKLKFCELRGVVMTLLYLLAIMVAEYDFRFGRKPLNEMAREAEEGRG